MCPLLIIYNNKQFINQKWQLPSYPWSLYPLLIIYNDKQLITQKWQLPVWKHFEKLKKSARSNHIALNSTIPNHKTIMKNEVRAWYVECIAYISTAIINAMTSWHRNALHVIVLFREEFPHMISGGFDVFFDVGLNILFITCVTVNLTISWMWVQHLCNADAKVKVGETHRLNIKKKSNKHPNTAVFFRMHDVTMGQTLQPLQNNCSPVSIVWFTKV